RLAESLRERGRKAAVTGATRRAELAAVIASLRAAGAVPDRVVHLLNVTAGEPPADARQRAFDSLLALAWALESERAAPGVCLAVASSHLHRLAGDAVAHPEKALLLGPVAVIPQEIEGLVCRSIDLVLPTPGSAEEEDLAEDLLAEIGAWGDPAETVVA